MPDSPESLFDDDIPRLYRRVKDRILGLPKGTFSVFVNTDFGQPGVIVREARDDWRISQLLERLESHYGRGLSGVSFTVGTHGASHPYNVNGTFRDNQIRPDTQFFMRSDAGRLLGGWGELASVVHTQSMARGNVRGTAFGSPEPENEISNWVYNVSTPAFFEHLHQIGSEACAPDELPRSAEVWLQIEALVPLAAGVGTCDHYAVMAAAHLCAQTPPHGATQYAYVAHLYPNRAQGGSFGHTVCVTSPELAKLGTLVSGLDTRLCTVIDGWHNDSASDCRAFLNGQNPYKRPCDLSLVRVYTCTGARLPPAARDAMVQQITALALQHRNRGYPTRTQPAEFSFPLDAESHDLRTSEQKVDKLTALYEAQNVEGFLAEVDELSPDGALLTDEQVTYYGRGFGRDRAEIPAAMLPRLFDVFAQMTGDSATRVAEGFTDPVFLACLNHSTGNRDKAAGIRALSTRIRGLIHQIDDLGATTVLGWMDDAAFLSWLGEDARNRSKGASIFAIRLRMFALLHACTDALAEQVLAALTVDQVRQANDRL